MMGTNKLLANKIFIDWNPINDGGKIIFHVNKFRYEDGVITEFTGIDQEKTHSESIANVARRFVGTGLIDPVTGNDISNISGAGVMVLIKELTRQVLYELESVDADSQGE